MATGGVVNQGKRPFVEKYFGSNPGGNLESVNQAWTAAGNEGTVSESLVGKVRASLGLTGKKSTEMPKPVEAPAKVKSKPKTSPKPKKVVKTVEQAPPLANSSATPAATAATSHDEDVLDELEEGIDDLIQKIRELGGKPDVVKALRRARRLLVRSHEG